MTAARRTTIDSPGFRLKRVQAVLRAALAAALHEHDATIL